MPFQYDQNKNYFEKIKNIYKYNGYIDYLCYLESQWLPYYNNGILDYYLLESKNNYKLIQQTLDDKTYCVKEITRPNICYTFEYATSYDTKRVETYDNILIEYGRAEKPRVTVEHYEPNIWLRLFTFCQAEDYYYITLPDHNYLSMTFD